uniref:NADH:ubiquinone reductase (H(+)-translocating) n=1 Tax=Bombus waltoni TaxID=395577 RepID=A0A649WEB3_9HYME|nr:NADH dehydrogenase subunit 5 [Bombus waltoni]QGK86773.1 NADH dehydrogenase subunit 5 [Bombus waltoni]
MIKMVVCGMMLLLVSLIFLILGLYMKFSNNMYIIEWMIFSFNSMKFNFIFIISFKSMMFIFLVLFISSMIFMYSISYMELNNKMIKRFYYLMLLFLMSMMFLILSPNMLTMLLGWDGLGLISYCLIIYYSSMKSFNSGLLTVILNRIGDSSLLMIMCFMMIFGSWNMMLYEMNYYIKFLFMLMAFTKSAQVIFMIWLPAAMMAPTPVSSLVHSSTLVTAGVYLLICYNDLIDLKNKEYLLLISSITMLISGFMANMEMDFKKIIALSTLSQLGFMMSTLSLDLSDLAFLHLFIHALFKSMMFMCVGSFIHYMSGIQNFRYYSGMFYLYPIKSMLMMFSLMMLCGFPFLVGFYSKDLIIEYDLLNGMSVFSLLNLIFGTLLTVSYSFRIIYTLMKNMYMMKLINLNEDKVMGYCMMFMLLFMLIWSKFVSNLFIYEVNLNLLFIYKIFVFKMMILGVMISMMFMKLNVKMEIVVFFKSFIYLEYFYVNFIKYSFAWLLQYEVSYEKGLFTTVTKSLAYFLSSKPSVTKVSMFKVLILTLYLSLMIISLNL